VPNRPAVILWQLLFFLSDKKKISWNYVIQIEVFFLRERFVNAKVQKITQKNTKNQKKNISHTIKKIRGMIRKN
jgi:hypothetical protein